MDKFIMSCCEFYDMEVVVMKDKFLPDAQNELIEIFLAEKFDYILFLDDDHWGHTKEMMDTLINANAYVSTIKSYSRHYPYLPALLIKNGFGFSPIEMEGYQEIDLCGFPMTLMKKELFSKLEKPYFRAIKLDDRDWHTDIDFYSRLGEIGIKPIGCFQHCLPHDKVTQENVNRLRSEETRELYLKESNKGA